MIKYSVPIVPRQLRLELTAKCNAACLTCHRHLMTRPIGDMSMELVGKCIEDARRFPQPLVELIPSNYNETFMFERWFEVLEMVQNRLPHTQIVVPTNGTFLKKVVDNLAKIRTLVLVNVSVNAFFPETYERFHHLDAKVIPEIVEGVKRLKQLRPDITIWVSAVYDYQIQSPKEIELFREFWSQYGTVQINTVSYAGVKGKEPLIPVSLPCRSIYSDMVVAWNGDISSCCFDANIQIKLGSALNSSLLDLWHGKEFANLRQIHNAGRRGEVPLCHSCTFS